MNNTNKIRIDSSFYYEEKGRIVFTENYHANRGYCCGNSCRHCCFWPRHTKGTTNIKFERDVKK